MKRMGPVLGISLLAAACGNAPPDHPADPRPPGCNGSYVAANSISGDLRWAFETSGECTWADCNFARVPCLVYFDPGGSCTITVTDDETPPAFGPCSTTLQDPGCLEIFVLEPGLTPDFKTITCDATKKPVRPCDPRCAFP